MSDPLQTTTIKRLPGNQHLTSLPPPKKPKQQPPETTDYDEDVEAHQQLISTLLASSSPSSPATDEATPFPFKVRFVPYPYLPLSPFECSSSYITINGNEETCGSSFSDADSSVMASVDTCGVHISDAFEFLSVENGNVLGVDEVMVKSREREEEEGGEDGWDWSEFLGDEECN